MSIQVTINLDRYSPGEIIQLCEDGVITVQEIIDSGVIPRVFGPELGNYVAQKTKEYKYRREGTTCEMEVKS